MAAVSSVPLIERLAWLEGGSLNPPLPLLFYTILHPSSRAYCDGEEVEITWGNYSFLLCPASVLHGSGEAFTSNKPAFADLLYIAVAYPPIHFFVMNARRWTGLITLYLDWCFGANSNVSFAFRWTCQIPMPNNRKLVKTHRTTWMWCQIYTDILTHGLTIRNGRQSLDLLWFRHHRLSPKAGTCQKLLSRLESLPL